MKKDKTKITNEMMNGISPEEEIRMGLNKDETKRNRRME